MHSCRMRSPGSSGLPLASRYAGAPKTDQVISGVRRTATMSASILSPSRIPASKPRDAISTAASSTAISTEISGSKRRTSERTGSIISGSAILGTESFKFPIGRSRKPFNESRATDRDGPARQQSACPQKADCANLGSAYAGWETLVAVAANCDNQAAAMALVSSDACTADERRLIR